MACLWSEVQGVSCSQGVIAGIVQHSLKLIVQEECRYLASCLASGDDSSLPTRHLLVLRCLLLKVRSDFIFSIRLH